MLTSHQKPQCSASRKNFRITEPGGKIYAIDADWVGQVRTHNFKHRTTSCTDTSVRVTRLVPPYLQLERAAVLPWCHAYFDALEWGSHHGARIKAD
jgi:hypothetical protein